MGKFVPFGAYLRVEAARHHWIPTIVLLREIREQDYQGGYSILNSFLLTLKSKENDAVARFETEPGEQMQVDFTVIRRGRVSLLAFVATLGWSHVTYFVSPVAKTPQPGVPVSKRRCVSSAVCLRGIMAHL